VEFLGSKTSSTPNIARKISKMTKKKHYEKTHEEDPKASFNLDGEKECYSG